ncbi:hypothetical protein F170042I7_21530 [Blautia caecimuris]
MLHKKWDETNCLNILRELVDCGGKIGGVVGEMVVRGVVGMAVGEMSDVKIEYVANGTQWEHMFCYRIARHVIIPPFCLVFKAK